MACRLALAGATATAAAARAPRRAVITAASASSAGEPARRIIRRRAPPGQQGSATAPPAQPSVAEVRRAIGVSDDDASAAASMEAKNSAFMDLIATTPIGKPESEPERRLREAAEWVVDNTETRACEGQKSFLVLCMMTFPAWFLLMFIALGVMKLPFDIPVLDNLLIYIYY
ncbi:probable NAD(P)H dehydrogenase subunit CRR3, chloroplastic isoform X2 [Miscanthus floridulus]|uniref:probable NAD(P)H dehydrogenase subunit CRR3, chloroplastic isoform X2 n=1 Tax=Miscanthus floridulus TaxID=154761 RepID=UPI00345B0808